MKLPIAHDTVVGPNGLPGRLVRPRVVWLLRHDVVHAAIPNLHLVVVCASVLIVMKFIVPVIRPAQSRVLLLSTVNGPIGEIGANVLHRVVAVSVHVLEPVTAHSRRTADQIVPAAGSSTPFATCTPVQRPNGLLLGLLGYWLMTQILDG